LAVLYIALTAQKLGMKEIKIKSLWGSGIPLGLLMSGMTDNIRGGKNDWIL
jgi:hypothetical protein